MSTDDKLVRLDYQLCFAVYATSHAFIRAYNHFLDAFGLSYPEYLFMLVAWEKDEQSLEEMAEKLRLPVEAIDKAAVKLEGQGYVTRRVPLDPSLSTDVSVTAQGLKLKDDVAKVRGQIGCMIGIDEDKMLSMRENLMQVLSSLEEEINQLKPARYNFL